MLTFITIPVSCFQSFAILLFSRIPIFVSCFKSFTILLTDYMSTLAAFIALFLSYYIFISYCRISVFLLPLLVLSPLLPIESLLFKIFKQFLLDEP